MIETRPAWNKVTGEQVIVDDRTFDPMFYTYDEPSVITPVRPDVAEPKPVVKPRGKVFPLPPATEESKE